MRSRRETWPWERALTISIRLLRAFSASFSRAFDACNGRYIRFSPICKHSSARNTQGEVIFYQRPRGTTHRLTRTIGEKFEYQRGTARREPGRAGHSASTTLHCQEQISSCKFSSPWERSIQIQLKLPSDSPREGPATRIITAVANSAILAGPALGMSFNCRKCMVRRRTARGLKLVEETVRVNVSGL